MTTAGAWVRAADIEEPGGERRRRRFTINRRRRRVSARGVATHVEATAAHALVRVRWTIETRHTGQTFRPGMTTGLCRTNIPKRCGARSGEAAVAALEASHG